MKSSDLTLRVKMARYIVVYDELAERMFSLQSKPQQQWE